MCPLPNLSIGIEGRSTIVLEFHRPSAMIVEVSDRKPVCKRPSVAGVVAVVMRDDHVIQLLNRQVCSLDHSQDAIEIAIAVPTCARIEQQRLTGGRDEQHGLPAL